MNFGREHLGKIVRVDSQMELRVPAGVFHEGEVLMFFNNTDDFLALFSDVENSYRSAGRQKRSVFEIPPRALINLVFVADNTLVMTVGL